jgi:AraC-like DNA-binding protein
VRARYLASLVDALRDEGIEASAWLRAVGIPEKLAERPDALLPRHQVYTFAALATQESGLSGLPFIAGSRIVVAGLGAAGRAVCRAPNLGQAIAVACDAFRDESSKFSLVAEPAPEGLLLKRGPIKGEFFVRQVIELYDLALMTNVARLGAGPAWQSPRVTLQTVQSSGFDLAAHLKLSKIRFGAAHTSILVPTHLLDAPLCCSKPPSANEPDLPPPPADFPGSVLAVLSAHPADAVPNVRQFSMAVGMSLRTLQRRFEGANTSYRETVRHYRCTAAKSMLRDTRLEIRQVAEALGYRDPGSFSRAFRSWTGVSPQRYQQETRRDARTKPPAAP